MEQLFIDHFLSNRRIVKTTAHLMSIVQGERETLKKFMHRFNAATLEIRNLDMGLALAALTTALQPGSFLYSLRKNPPMDMGELMARAQKYINLEEMMDTRGSRIELKKKGNSRKMGESSKSAKRHEATTGYLSRFIKKEDPSREPHEQRRPNANDKDEQFTGEIAVIFGESASGGDSRGTRKRYAKQVLLVEKGKPNRKRSRQGEDIIFDSRDEEGVQQPHNDALVLSLLVANYKFRHVLIDNGSSKNIMFWSVVEGMKIGKERLKPIATPLVGFGGDVVHPVGTIILPVTMGTTPQQVSSLTEFLVVDWPSVYNIILGRLLLNAV
ncbi:uncharacterized protein LOC131149690 [Malania oleifera]|uniref:uncharacterized protein LOC131149690 n=1 Tax=Malania oleifera TaxID=397392 RepID=UPI0025AE39FE|nr:uncharacterized protein LOC131149690 [Malania oleifera]